MTRTEMGRGHWELLWELSFSAYAAPPATQIHKPYGQKGPAKGGFYYPT